MDIASSHLQFGLDGFEFLAQFKDKILQALFISVFVTVVRYIDKRLHHNNLRLCHLTFNI